jgi:hypothetical protein
MSSEYARGRVELGLRGEMDGLWKYHNPIVGKTSENTLPEALVDGIKITKIASTVKDYRRAGLNRFGEGLSEVHPGVTSNDAMTGLGEGRLHPFHDEQIADVEMDRVIQVEHGLLDGYVAERAQEPRLEGVQFLSVDIRRDRSLPERRTLPG